MQGLHEFDQVGLPQFSIEMAEMPVRIGSGGDQDVEAILDPRFIARSTVPSSGGFA